MNLSSELADGNSSILQHFVGSMILIVPSSVKIAMNLRSLSSSNVVTDIGIIEITFKFIFDDDIVAEDANEVKMNSVKFNRELDVADKQFASGVDCEDEFVVVEVTLSADAELYVPR